MWRRGSGGRLLVLGVAVLVAGGVARTHLRNRDWRTRETLLRSVGLKKEHLLLIFIM